MLDVVLSLLLFQKKKIIIYIYKIIIRNSESVLVFLWSDIISFMLT